MQFDYISILCGVEYTHPHSQNLLPINDTPFFISIYLHHRQFQLYVTLNSFTWILKHFVLNQNQFVNNSNGSREKFKYRKFEI